MASDPLKTQILSQLEPNYRQYIEENMQSQNTINQKNIQNILSRNYRGDLLKGGKRKRKQKTMKKIGNKRTKKLMKNLKGGYVYSSSKDLDKASSIISASSKSKSNSNSKSKSKSKSNSSKKSHKTKRRSKQ